jgi:hypothetical protein
MSFVFLHQILCLRPDFVVGVTVGTGRLSSKFPKILVVS